MFPKHLKPFLTLKKPHNPHQHCKGQAEFKEPVQHLSFQGIRRVTDDKIAVFWRLCLEKIAAVIEMRCYYIVADNSKNLNKEASFCIKRAPNSYAPIYGWGGDIEAAG